MTILISVWIGESSRPTAVNVWSLHGYVECRQRQGKDVEAQAAQARLDLAQARADVEIYASCFCRLETHCRH